MSKLVKTTITSMAILLIVAIAALIVVLNISGDKDEGKAESIDKIVEYAYETPEITTDLEDGSFVRIQFQILTDGKDAKEEISKRDFQLKNILIKELATMNEEKFKTGLTDLEAEVKTKLNAVMTEGKITNVYTVSKILQ
ncbi:flagellar basal body-associated protein FliL [Virgibacillus halodenitrificans]|uniref:Flagellar protein FliL n=1 Tax=Virgibacillus halodenitrificans TaxID=1482 RepID=A0ABR7VQJ0_VIRHA|nr:flagellar basal body-associated protein FliL [Virgibacillus halodenitrificans]MBD1224173.1 flagellar basal body-associated protein FliL [Virgibacillus halodenitrificans]MEC2160307.1 flagellar basal body-associated protein FliL [Virgibacillus halodenitrificans]WHX27169.1 flagellar basal body-associated protein FliL [Virgibacillus halodenitrificans]